MPVGQSTWGSQTYHTGKHLLYLKLRHSSPICSIIISGFVVGVATRSISIHEAFSRRMGVHFQIDDRNAFEVTFAVGKGNLRRCLIGFQTRRRYRGIITIGNPNSSGTMQQPFCPHPRKKLWEGDKPPRRRITRSRWLGVVIYGFGDASGSGFGGSIQIVCNISYHHGLWWWDRNEALSNHLELRNLVETMEEWVTTRDLWEAEVFIFTDNSVVEAAFYKSNSLSKLFSWFCDCGCWIWEETWSCICYMLQEHEWLLIGRQWFVKREPQWRGNGRSSYAIICTTQPEPNTVQ